MMGLTSLEVHSFLFHIAQEIKNFKLYADLVDEFSLTELKDELEEILHFSDITPQLLQDKILGSRIIKAYKKLESPKGRSDGYIMLKMVYTRAPFHHFEILKVILAL